MILCSWINCSWTDLNFSSLSLLSSIFFYEWKIFRLFISSCLIVASLTSSTAIENFQQFSFFVSTVRRFMYRWICKTIWLSISGICRVYEVDLPLNCVYLLTTTLHAVLYGEMKNENLSAAQLIASFCVCLNHLWFYKPSSSDIVSSDDRSVVVERKKMGGIGVTTLRPHECWQNSHSSRKEWSNAVSAGNR